ncbi:kinase-like domain-containing protein [Suillus variegatus]|nr:kinase-like domain-containing protein [Suillus variegatus]
MSTSLTCKSYLNESSVLVKINDKDDGDIFVCDEEPHMLSPEQGFGYYPITLGRRLGGGRLEIVRKLGWAGYSSVWLARTLGTKYPAKYVAVKVLTANATAGVLAGSLGEVDSLRTVKTANPAHPGYRHCLHLYDTIGERSSHGPHICIVTNVLGANVTSLRTLQPNLCGAFPLAIAKCVVKQTLLALDYLHRECGLVHTDVKPDNTLICVDHVDEVLTRLLQEIPSASYAPRLEPDLSPHPITTVKSQPLSDFGLREDASNLNICLVDYGHATPIREHLLEKVQPILLRAPEVILGHAWSTPIDIWSVGCLVFEYLSGAALFKLWESSSMSIDNVHLQQIFELMGHFPPSFLEGCCHRADFFDHLGNTIENCLRLYNGMEEKDIPPAAAFIRRCLTIDPRARPTALELLDDEWLKNA